MKERKNENAKLQDKELKLYTLKKGQETLDRAIQVLKMLDK